MKIYHGSLQQITEPHFGLGNPKTDYGLGFYCTENLELAKEWGCSEEKSGFANEYEFDTSGLKILNLNQDYNILNWLAILLENRTFELRQDISKEGKEYILSNFLIDYQSYDVIKGYRADDSYFSFANAFLENTISLQKLNTAMKLGFLGEQIVLKSEKSFNQIHYLQSHISNKDVYFPQKMERDSKARKDFFNLKTKNEIKDKDTIFLIDIIRQEVTLNDSLLQRALSM